MNSRCLPTFSAAGCSSKLCAMVVLESSLSICSMYSRMPSKSSPEGDSGDGVFFSSLEDFLERGGGTGCSGTCGGLGVPSSSSEPSEPYSLMSVLELLAESSNSAVRVKIYFYTDKLPVVSAVELIRMVCHIFEILIQSYLKIGSTL